MSAKCGRGHEACACRDYCKHPPGETTAVKAQELLDYYAGMKPSNMSKIELDACELARAYLDLLQKVPA